MTPFEITGLGIMISYYLMKYLRGREKRLGECLWDYLDERKKPKPKRGGIVRGNFTELMQPGLRNTFQDCQFMGIPGFTEGFDDEYWQQRGLGRSAQQEQQNSLIAQINDAFEQRTGVYEIQAGSVDNDINFTYSAHYPGKIYHVDHANKMVTLAEGVEIPMEEFQQIYDEEYWRKWKAKHKHEKDGG